MVLVLSLLALTGWGVPMKWIATGEIFRRKFTYVWSGIGDSFNAAVGKMVLASVFLFAVFAGVVGMLKWFTAGLNRIERGVFRILIVLLGLFPLSAAAIAFVMVVRLTLDMGTTPKRLLGLGCTAGGIMVISGWLWLLLRFQRKPGTETDAAPNRRPPSHLSTTSEVQSSESQGRSASGGCG